MSLKTFLKKFTGFQFYPIQTVLAKGIPDGILTQVTNTQIAGVNSTRYSVTALQDVTPKQW